MSNNNYSPDEPTLPAQPYRPNQGPPQPPQQQGPQGKLVLGSFNNPPQQQQQWPNQYMHNQAAPPGTPYYPGSPQPPGQQPPYSSGRGFQAGRRRPRRARSIGCLVLIVLVLLLCGFAFTTSQKVLAFGSAISTQTPLSTQTGYMSITDRTSVLMMGYGGGSHGGANLTDSMSVVSVMPQSHHTSLISVPRDLWVQSPPNSGQYAKLNTVYSNALAAGKSPAEAGDTAAQKVSAITGLDVKYWVTINFTGFRDLIDAIGGVDVYVPDSFNACYPKNDNDAVDASWIKVQFNKGQQHMNGETAIEYARAREPLAVCGMGASENPAELSDFGRSARQQIIMKAVLAKFKQVTAWPHFYSAMDALQHTIYSNMSLADLSEFALHMDLNNPQTAHIGLSNQNVLQDVTEPDGEAALSPTNNDWQAVADYVKQHLYN